MPAFGKLASLKKVMHHPPLQEGLFYHIYNRGNNRETLFRTTENYRFFLERYAKYIEPVAATYAYCLLPNHFHFLVKIRKEEEQEMWHQSCQLSESWQLLNPTRSFQNLFVSYAMAYNKQQKRSGSLFQKPFRRKIVDNDRYFITLITYIHRNPQLHGLVDDFRDWPWSSYGAILSDQPTRVQRTEVIDWFMTRANFIDTHLLEADEQLIAPLIDDDW
jgi:putative transposase